MSTVTLSTRLAKDEARKIDELAGGLGLDRGSLLKQRIRNGYADIQTRRAFDAYRHGTITLSRAAEIAGLSLRDMLLQLPEESNTADRQSLLGSHQQSWWFNWISYF
ncbi:MAG: hypothetical protein JW883_01325 [Deltaproteobacteria bacterium]|jgi:hypothetical protein|nr:hypothetical protein [Deltaproteobacteria bacterium]